MELLDCTIRDGGYVNNWEFTDEEVKECYKCVSDAGFSYFEIGFRTNKNNKGKGKWFYCTENDINNVKNYVKNGCKISIMTRIENENLDLKSFVHKNNSSIDMIRIFLTYESEDGTTSSMSISKLEKCRDVILHLKKLGYTISLNIGSTIVITDDDFHNIFNVIIKHVKIDYLYFADSYGSLLFNKFDYYIGNLKKYLDIYDKKNIKIGFHGHNNLGNAYTNFIKCIESNIDIVDSTITGLGRGSGNLHSEICVLHMYRIQPKQYNVSSLLDYSNKYISQVNKFYGKYNYGYNNILMICGMYNIHPNYGLELLKKYNMKASEYFSFLLKLKSIIIAKNKLNYDKNLISNIIDSKLELEIKAIFIDFDGTLSDGKIYIDNEGNEIKTNNTKDGYIIKKLQEKYIFSVISGSNLNFFKKRAYYIGIKNIFDNITIKESKLKIIEDFCIKHKININNVAYIGDDLNDLDVIKKTFSACPNDATEEIKKNVSYICKKKGGYGCVREFIEFIECKKY